MTYDSDTDTWHYYATWHTQGLDTWHF